MTKFAAAEALSISKTPAFANTVRLCGNIKAEIEAETTGTRHRTE